MKIFIQLLYFLLLACFSNPDYAQQMGNESLEFTKTALVIGVKDYKYASPLQNPINDAIDISDSLRSIGFFVVIDTNSNYKIMKDRINEWCSSLDKYDVGLFYFSGHGTEYDGFNYLFPVDANPQKASDLNYETIAASMVLEKMQSSKLKVNIILLDACRSNPFSRKWSKGNDNNNSLAAMSGNLKEVFIGLAAAPSKPASDNVEGRNGVYTSAILKYLTKEDLSISDMFTRVNGDVQKSTGEQVSWFNTSMTKPFYFNVKRVNKISTFVITTRRQSSNILMSADNYLIVADDLNGELLFKDLNSNKQYVALTSENLLPFKLATMDGRFFYAIDRKNNCFFEIDEEGNLKNNVIKLNYSPVSLILSSTRNKAYILVENSNKNDCVLIVDLTKHKTIDTIWLNTDVNELVGSSDDKYLFGISSSDTSQFITVDLKTHRISKVTSNYGVPTAIALTSDNGHLYVANANSIESIDCRTGKIVGAINCKAQSFSITDDGRYLFAISGKEIVGIKTSDNSIVSKTYENNQPSSIVLNSNGDVYIWYNEQRRVRLTDAGTLLKDIFEKKSDLKLDEFIQKYNSALNIDTIKVINTKKELCNRINEIVASTAVWISDKLYKTCEPHGTGYDYVKINYKDVIYCSNWGVRNIVKHEKNIIPTIEGRLDNGYLKLSIKEGDETPDSFTTLENNIDWEALTEFIKNYYCSRLNKLI